MNQTKKGSFLEQLCNVGSGFFVALFYWQLVIVPQLVAHPDLTLAYNTFITMQFTVISVARGYLWRRIFNYYLALSDNDGT